MKFKVFSRSLSVNGNIGAKEVIVAIKELTLHLIQADEWNRELVSRVVRLEKAAGTVTQVAGRKTKMLSSYSHLKAHGCALRAVLPLLWMAAPGGVWAQSSWPNYPNNSVISVTSGGNVGIGTSSPSYQLDVQGTGSNAMRVLSNTSGLTYLDVFNSNWSTSGSGSVLRLITGNTAGTAYSIVDMVKYANGLFAINNNETSARRSDRFWIGGSRKTANNVFRQRGHRDF